MFTKEAIEKHFLAQKAESWVFMAIGIAGMSAGHYCFFLFKNLFL